MRSAYAVLVVSAVLHGCGGALYTTNAAGTIPTKGTLIPATDVKVSPTYTVTLEKLIYWGGVAALAYYVIDPAAPNWQIQEIKLPDDRYHMNLQMKRYYTGGAGEARAVFQRRAKELVRAGGYREFQIIDYSEGMDSNAIGSQRVAEGTIQLVRK